MGNIVFKYGGIVDKYLGDGFLALFGAPASSTRDADNAVEAALKMQEIVIEFLDFWGEETPSVPLEIGISIHTGEVVVGNIGFDRKMDYTVIGDTVNEVFRLQQVTKLKPNSIVISGSTKRAATSKLNLSPIPVPEAFRDIFEDMGIYELHNNVPEQPKNVLPHSPGPAQH
jgi:class 3 adenylate cyclase